MFILFYFLLSVLKLFLRRVFENIDVLCSCYLNLIFFIFSLFFKIKKKIMNQMCFSCFS